MARGDVTDLVPEHAGELRLVVEKHKDAAGDVDVAAGQRERVDSRDIDRREMPRQIGAFRHLGQAHPGRGDVFLQRAIVVHAHFAAHFDVVLLPGGNFLLLAHQRELALAGSRIGCARSHGDGKRDRQTCCFHDEITTTQSALRPRRSS